MTIPPQIEENPYASLPVAHTGCLQPNCTHRSQYIACEICFVRIKGYEHLRLHMILNHKILIHQFMVECTPPLNCHKCPTRFLTFQGLERHLLWVHGLVVKNMEEAINNGYFGQCRLCGYQEGRLLDHLVQVHMLPVKRACINFVCAACEASYDVYDDFQVHVSSKHDRILPRKLTEPIGRIPLK